MVGPLKPGGGYALKVVYSHSDLCCHLQATKDKDNTMDGVVEIPDAEDKDEVCAAVAANVLWQMEADRKTTALKQLQGHIWREAYKTAAVLGESVLKHHPQLYPTLFIICFVNVIISLELLLNGSDCRQLCHPQIFLQYI